MNITILGTGAYGLALALKFNENKNNNISMWTKFNEEADMLNITHEHTTLFPGVNIPNNIFITSDLKRALINSNIIVIAVPAKFVSSVCKEIKDFVTGDEIILIASKGIERVTCRFISDVVEEELTNQISVISGPTFAVDLVTNIPVGLSLASTDSKSLKIIQDSLSGKYVKLRETDDVIGVEICGAIKNVIAIASGILDGLNLPISTKAMFITESLHDIRSLLDALGGKKNTILSFAGFGDLLLTCTSEKSRNYSFGKLLGSKKSKEEIEKYKNNTTIEGVYTLESIYTLIKNKNVDMPIIDLIYDIVEYKKDPTSILEFLMTKS